MPEGKTKTDGQGDTKKRPSGKTNDMYVSRTDPEATVFHNTKTGLRLTYKAHVSVSGKKGLVVTAAILTTGIVGEEHVLNDVLKSHTHHTGITVKEAVADTKYGSLANYVSLNQAGIIAFIPPHERTNGVNGFWGKDQFRYVTEKDIYLCPAGKTLKLLRAWPHEKRIIYRCEPGTCQSCQLNKKCTTRGNPKTITRFVDQRLIEEARRDLGILPAKN